MSISFLIRIFLLRDSISYTQVFFMSGSSLCTLSLWACICFLTQPFWISLYVWLLVTKSWCRFSITYAAHRSCGIFGLRHFSVGQFYCCLWFHAARDNTCLITNLLQKRLHKKAKMLFIVSFVKIPFLKVEKKYDNKYYQNMTIRSLFGKFYLYLMKEKYKCPFLQIHRATLRTHPSFLQI